MTTAQSRIAAFASARVLVLGDVMLDRFVSGSSDRISPEAPIAVLSVDTEWSMPGGAGNVARNIVSLGGHAILLGVVGDDAAGREIHKWLDGEGNVTGDLVVAPDRPTTQKIRYIANRQQLLRVDVEKCHAAEAQATTLLARFQKHLPNVDVVVLSDYGKGVLCDRLLADVISVARQAGKPVILDPKRADMRNYDGVTVLTPNFAEASRATHVAGDSDADVERSAEALLALLPATESVLITRGARGMSLKVRGRKTEHFLAATHQVYDVSGAGDTVVATLALALASGGSLAEAAELANVAAGLAVAKPGTATIAAGELSAALFSSKASAIESKICGRAALLDRLAIWRAERQRIGFTNGCFDLVHPGHIALLRQARAACQRLIVGLNNDASTRRLKGAGRPLQSETARALVMAALEPVDLVVLFDEDTPMELIKTIRPDVIVKGADYRGDQVVGADFVKSYGGDVKLVPLVDGESTTRTNAKRDGG